GSAARAVPGDVAAQSLVESRRGPPAEQLDGFGRGDLSTSEVAGPGFEKLDVDRTQNLGDGLGDPAHGDRFAAFEVERLILALVGEAPHVGVREILDVYIVPKLQTITVDRDRLARQ